ncbi:alpha amylase [Catenovulum agarivorans DS-2]|uniref:Alpha amylase n=1 Tax=Catenovulum agarivorans DS-2 TaxID=1328313 RepID=W7QIM1_9ALTE|nr:alpha-amylase family glycosyl hydrolase [Catenovulum agarivorans]EWH08772.1 alpha amylase [Catenovulum agarivorans DS-2]
MPNTKHSEQQLAKVIENRLSDWRCGALVYQVLVDRFAPAENLAAKQTLYPAPKKLKQWHETPKHGEYLAEHGLWSHEIEFWGGDLTSLQNKLDYIAELGMDILYLNPIHHAYTNHKYDSLDFHQVSPEFGDRQAVKSLTDATHAKGMKIVLDGVFNHMGQNAPIFKQAAADKHSQYRDWFDFNPDYPAGHRSWSNAVNLPELNLENIQVRQHIWLDEDSVVQSYLAQGIDGWRLDVAHDIGFDYLAELKAAAQSVKADALIVGEIWCYPQQWFPSVDGVMNFTAREIFWHVCEGTIAPATANQMLAQMVSDAGIDNLLKSWLVLDNHDTARLPNMLPEQKSQRLAQILHFTFPGSPTIYYGSELGMTGGDDPEMRAPMRWDLLNNNAILDWHKHLLKIRKNNPALKVGEFRTIITQQLVAYERYTDQVADSVFVVVNPNPHPVEEYLMLSNSKLMNMGGMYDLLGNISESIYIKAGVIKLALPAHSAALLKADTSAAHGYTTYKRVK